MKPLEVKIQWKRAAPRRQQKEMHHSINLNGILISLPFS